MTNPCEIGLKCPFMKCSEEGDLICVYPYAVVPEEETFGTIDVVDCSLVEFDSSLEDYLFVYTMENRRVKTYCARCGKSGHVYPVKYTEPMKNQCYAVDLCFKCAHEHHKVMTDWCNTREESE